MLALVIDRGVAAEVGKINKELGRLAHYKSMYWTHVSSADYSGLLNDYIGLKLNLHVLRKSLYYPHDAYVERENVERTLARCEELRAQIDAARDKKEAAIWGSLAPPRCDWPYAACKRAGDHLFKARDRHDGPDKDWHFCGDHMASGPKAVDPAPATHRWVQTDDEVRLEPRQCALFQECQDLAVGFHKGFALCSRHRHESHERARRDKAMRRRGRYYPRTGGVLRPMPWSDRMADLFGEVHKGDGQVDFVYMSPQDIPPNEKYLWGAVLVRDPHLLPGRVRLNSGPERVLYSGNVKGTYFTGTAGITLVEPRTNCFFGTVGDGLEK
jgi:hypothetical protein